MQCKYKDNDCFIQCFIDSYILYKIRRYSEDYCSIEKIFVTHNRYSYDVDKMKTEYCNNFDNLERFHVNVFDKMRDKIQSQEKKIQSSKLELVNSLLNSIKRFC